MIQQCICLRSIHAYIHVYRVNLKFMGVVEKMGLKHVGNFKTNISSARNKQQQTRSSIGLQLSDLESI